ncbi:helix-turn-helix domain-containing protein [Kineococcus radiotolerans]|uniref:Transcriptional regulator, XRE family n=1 Tax=Kineococcus radiotolerans (strain ATCC BAA-149 / DSM 14245 / SRS30216) TaxID=266940 RepID=A6W8X5_KINRD|nr:helix-turn-helix transcriptional regulator [Kineococcus radiotolerans]ABS03264.1 transcriptional regulator, XRE family [Kineococcus radiotolerans SRS30216 = ATCC BAA-149]
MARLTNGSTVRALREALGVSGRVCAQRVGISPGYLANIEAAKKQPTPRVVRALADTLGVGIDVITYVIPEHIDPSALEELVPGDAPVG